jgi:hypothetical protein
MALGWVGSVTASLGRTGSQTGSGSVSLVECQMSGGAISNELGLMTKRSTHLVLSQ